MVDKKNIQLGNLFAVLLILNVCIAFYSRWVEYFLFINIAFIVLGLIVSPKIHREDTKMLIIVFLWAMATLPLTKGGLGSALTFFVTIAMLEIYSSLYFGKRVQKLLVVGCCLGALLMLDRSLIYGENYKLALLYNKNPNSIAAYAVFFCMFLSVFLDLQKKWSKIAFVAIVAVTVATVLNCRSRGALITLIVFMLLLFIPQKLWTYKRIMLLVTAIVIVGTLIPFVYVFLYKQGYQMQILGKSLFTGREDIWLEMFRQIRQKATSILVGLGSNAQIWKKDLNVHNNFFAIFVNFGIIGYLLHFFVIFRFIRRIAERIKTAPVRKELFAFICATLVLGFFESTSLNNSLAPFSYFGLVYASGKQQNSMKILEKEDTQT